MATECSGALVQATSRTNVMIPDMFQSFVVLEPFCNPHYESVKAESEAWIKSFCDLSPRAQAKIEKCDFSFFCAIAAPCASRSKFRTLCDWGNWVFPFDDMFDNGRLKDAPEAAAQVISQLMAPMRGEHVDQTDRLAIVRVHDTVVSRLEQCPKGIQKRFAVAMANYCRGALTQVQDHFDGRTPTVEEMITIRRESAGVAPLYHLVEYAHDLQVPEEAFEHPLIQELEALGSDLVSISNDILSYRKEEREGVKHNIVAIYRLNGMAAQEAFDEAGRLLEKCHQRWEIAEDLLTKLELACGKDVASYVTGIKSVVQANISWSFRSERYLGLEAKKVRDTRLMDVLTEPPFLAKTLSRSEQPK